MEQLELNKTLYRAAKQEDWQGVKDALDAGADVNYIGMNKMTPLMFAAVYRCYDIVELLLQHRADVNVMGHFNALMEACRGGDIRIVKALVSLNADIHAIDAFSEDTALHYAAHYGHLDIVKFLLEKEANINAVNEANMTPLIYAADHGHLDIVKFLVQAGADIQVRTGSKQTAYDCAKENKHDNIVSFFDQLELDGMIEKHDNNLNIL